MFCIILKFFPEYLEFLCNILEVQDRQLSESVSHLASQLVNNSSGRSARVAGNQRGVRAAIPEPPFPLSPHPPGTLAPCHPPPLPLPFPIFHFHSGSHSPSPAIPFSCAGCKSSTIALIYNFCLAMQNT